MSRIWVAILALIVIGAAVYAAVRWTPSATSPGISTSTSVATTPAAPTIEPGVASEQYVSAQYGFSIWYPADAAVGTTTDQGYVSITQTPVVSFDLPSSLFAGTNLVEAGVVVGATSTSDIAGQCASAAEGETASGTEMVAGQQFSVFTGTGAGAGQIYQTKALRAVSGDTCYEIVEFLHSAQVGNFPAGSVTAFDQQEFETMLDAMAQSFSFTSTTGS